MAKKVASAALQKYDARFAEMAKQAKTAVSAVGAGGNFISFKGGVMQYKGARIPEDKMRCVVIDAIPVNEFYGADFDPDGFSAPDCYAMGRAFESGELIKPADLAPNPADVPRPCNPTCDGCPKHEWGSADKGRGKACKETQRLALLAEGDLENNIEDGEIAYIKVPVTSIKNWAGYSRQLIDVFHRTALAFVTEISLVKATDGSLPGWSVEFKQVLPIEDPPVLDALFGRYDEVVKAIAFPWQKNSEAAPAQNGRGARRTAPPPPVARGGKAVRPR